MSKKKTEPKTKQFATIDETFDPKSVEQFELRMKNVAEFAKYSFELERKREQSVVEQTGQMLTASSVTSAAVLLAVPILLEHTCVSPPIILFSSGAILVCIFVSMAFAIYSQWRFKYETLMSGMEFLLGIEADIEDYVVQAQYDYQWINQLTDIQDSKKENNDKRCRYIVISMRFFFAAIIILIVCSFIISVLCLRSVN